MINNAPRSKGKYKQGLFIPTNKDKVIKLNNKGGIYFRSGLEEKMMIYFDKNPAITKWSAEWIQVPYTKKTWNTNLQSFVESTHTYYPDFYYETEINGVTKRVVVEVKPDAETRPPVIKENMNARQLKNTEYALKMFNTNMTKWKHMIEFCKRKGFEFIILTEKHIERR